MLSLPMPLPLSLPMPLPLSLPLQYPGGVAGVAGVLDLPLEVLHRIVGDTDQQDAAALMLASKQLYGAIHTPSIWKSLDFSTLDSSAANFVQFASECQELTLRGESPEEIVCFIEKLRRRGATGSVVTLRAIVVEPCARMTSQLFEAAAAFPRLEVLSMRLQGVTADSDDILVDVTMPNLRVLEFVEIDDHEILEDDDEMGVSIMFSDTCRFPALETVKLLLHTSNVLAAVDRMPLLRHLTYVAEDDCYPEEEMTKLAGRRFDTLTLSTQYEGAGGLIQGIAECEVVRHLTLLVYDDLVIDAALPNVREVTVILAARASVSMNFVALTEKARHEAVVVRSPARAGTFRLTACPSVDKFAEFWNSHVLRVSNTALVVDPNPA